MQNILIITPNFKLNSQSRTTKVVNEWAEGLTDSNYDVHIHHIRVKYIIFKFFPIFLKNFLISNFDYTPPESEYQSNSKYKFSYSFVFINRFLPKIKINKNQKSKILNSLPLQKFDYVVLHWHNPCVHLISQIIKSYGRLNLVLHDFSNVSALSKINTNFVRFFARNNDLMLNYENVGIKSSGIIHSYINPDFFINQKMKLVSNKSILTVSSLIKRKNIKSILYSISNSNWTLDVIGDGPDRKMLEKFSINNNCNVKFYGLQSRDFIIKMMDTCSIFILPSKNEAFGLVYLEAMSRGMIVIGSKGEGVDGIIIHGKNGFLVESGSQYQVSETLNYINDLKDEEISAISNLAIVTSRRFNKKNISNDYVSKLIKT